MVFAISTTAGYGVLTYSFGVLLTPMSRDLGWSKAFLSGAFSAALVVAALAGPLIGRRLDRHSPRGLLLGLAALSSLLVVAWAAAQTKAEFFAVWLLLGIGQAALFYGPAFTVLTKLYGGRSRYRAITSISLVAGLASTIFAPSVALLAGRLGWRGAVLVLAAVLALATIPPFWFGLGSITAREESHPSPGRPREVLRSRTFWTLTAAYLVSGAATLVVAVHLVGFLQARGFSLAIAAACLGGVGLVQVLGRLFFVRLTDRVRGLRLGTWSLAAKGLGVGALLLLPGWPGVVVFLLVYGSANGLTTLTQATSVSELYGARHFGSISSVVTSVAALGAAGAPFAAAAASDAFGGDGPVFAGVAAMLVVAAALNGLVSPPAAEVEVPPT
ncbi:MAG TPA: MFS transporter [Candidatus Dormibacteraeota bacterium]